MTRKFYTSLLALTLLACQPVEQIPLTEILELHLPCNIATDGCTVGNDNVQLSIKFDQNFGALKPFTLQLQLDQNTPLKVDEINLNIFHERNEYGTKQIPPDTEKRCTVGGDSNITDLHQRAIGLDCRF